MRGGVVGLPTGGLMHSTCESTGSWSSLRLVRSCRRFIGIPVLLGLFHDIVLVKRELYLFCWYSTDVVWLLFVARRQTNQLTQTSSTCQLPRHWLVPRPHQTLDRRKQTRKSQSTYRTSQPCHARPAGKKQAKLLSLLLSPFSLRLVSPG